jgi:hypothetical protein
MNENNRTPSILQRAPVILAVTAAAYGLPLQRHGQRAEPKKKPPAGGFGSSATRFSYRLPERCTTA